jgi:hypothetical protein
MAGDIGVSERLLFPGQKDLEAFAAPEPVLHEYGPNIQIALSSTPELLTEAAESPMPQPKGLSETEQLGYEALQLRLSDKYRVAKEERRYRAMSWDGEGTDADSLHADKAPDAAGLADLGESAAGGDAGAPAVGTSDRLKGRVALSIIMVSGPEPGLVLSNADQVKIVAEIQNGLGWLGAQSPARDVTFVYETHALTVDVPNDVTGGDYETFEAPWRDAAMAQLGVGPGLGNVRAYVNALRGRLGTDWAYCTFFTRYNLRHFAYAGIGGPRLVMHFENDGWGVENIDRVFAHESGHIFGAPDEYASSGCDCGGAWGVYGRPNSNCANCAPGGGVPCIMRSNEWAMCDHTKLHLGF